MNGENTKKIRLGLIGKDVSKSLSERMHRFILQEMGVECDYERFSITPRELDDVIWRLMGDFDGFNITIPYKRDIFEYLDDIDADAVACGAVNTVVSATKCGYNTDGAGFLLMLATKGIQVKDKSVLILGFGGAGRSAAVALKNAGATVFAYRRNQIELKEACAQIGVTPTENPEKGGYDIIVNTTGVGMHDSVGVSPVSEKAFDGVKVAVDMIYEPKKSEFLRLAESKGLQICNGDSMLFYQAYYADCIYLQQKQSEREAKALYKKYLAAYGEKGE